MLSAQVTAKVKDVGLGLGITATRLLLRLRLGLVSTVSVVG